MNENEPSPAREIAGILKSNLSTFGKGTAIAYSGGLDSSVLMAASGFALTAYSVGIQGSKDIQNAKTASELLNFPLRMVTITEDDIVNYRELLKGIDPEITRVELGYEIVLASVLDNVSEDRVVTGQGADELFYGYRRFIDDPALSNEGHLKKLYEVTLPRETKLSKHFGKTLITPFLDSEIVRVAASMGRNEHIRGETRKVLLRKAASVLGLPKEISEMPKKAAQYGSGVNKVLSKLK